jgi:PAS domain S-box-containing protein
MSADSLRPLSSKEGPAAEELLNAIVDSSDDAIISKDLNGIVTSWNKSAARIFGYAAEEMVGRPMTTLLPAERIGEEDGILRKVRMGERIDHFETIRRRKDGTLIDVAISISPVRSAEGKIVGASSIARDISEIKRSMRADLLLSAIVDSSDDAIASKDLNGIITSWNPGAERIFGYTAAEIVGQSVMKLVPPDRHDEERAILKRLREGERIDHIETVRVRKSGEHFDVSITISPVKNAEGKIVGASKILRDISELKRTMRADLHLSAIVNSSDDAIISKNLSGIVQSWNAGAQRIFGYLAEEIIGQSVTKLIPADRQDEEPRIIERLKRGDRVDHFETVRVRKGGEHFPVSLTISPVRNALGEIIGASKIARDITDLRNIAAERETLLESERTARAQAEHANRMKDEFLSTVSHELRTPLNAIVAWTEVLAEGESDRTEVLCGVDVIKKNAIVQAQLIEDLLDLERITSGKMELKAEPVDLSIILREAVEALQHAADSKEIVLKTRTSGLRGGQTGDAKRLRQVFWNLLTNAIKFTDRGGSIVVDAIQLKSTVEISFTDDGIGIEPQFLPHLFERFRQADASTTRKQGGLGIGLSLVKQLVELHGGFVRAESDGLGLGARFVVSLPSAAEAQSRPGLYPAKPDAEHSHLNNLSGIKVLALDDDVDSVEALRRILGRRQAEVKIAHSMAEALEVLGTFLPDVIVSDIGMPGHDGYEFVQYLRDNSLYAGIPAVALTALARIDDRTQALNAGFQTHIAKPVAAAELVAVVRSLAKLHLARDPDAISSRIAT